MSLCCNDRKLVLEQKLVATPTDTWQIGKKYYEIALIHILPR